MTMTENDFSNAQQVIPFTPFIHSMTKRSRWEDFATLIKTIATEQNIAKHSSKKRKHNIYTNDCKWCDYTNTLENDVSQGNIVCRNCGCINGTIISDAIEWKMKTESNTFYNDPTHCAPIDELLPNLSLSTKIAPTYGGPNSYFEYRISRLNQWQAGNPLERALKNDFMYIDGFQYKRKYGFSKNILQTTKMLFKEFYIASYNDAKEYGGKRNCLRGSVRKGMIGICIYFACKINNIHCTKKYIADILEINKVKIRKAKPIFLAKMKDKINNIKNWNCQVSKISNVGMFIRMYQNILNTPYYIFDYTYRFYKTIKPYGVLYSKQPQSVAIVCLFVVLMQIDDHITVYDIIDKCDISKATIKDLWKKITPYKSIGLINVFIPHVCEKLTITNTITVTKMCQIGCIINRIFNDKININLVIATAIYFVIIIQKIHPNIQENTILKICNVTHTEIMDVGKTVFFYKHALIKYIIN